MRVDGEVADFCEFISAGRNHPRKAGKMRNTLLRFSAFSCVRFSFSMFTGTEFWCILKMGFWLCGLIPLCGLLRDQVRAHFGLYIVTD